MNIHYSVASETYSDASNCIILYFSRFLDCLS
nr:MAG TPA: hypothetical protein [Caudoviricetes sp.]